MIDFNRWSEMEVCDRSRFELCHLTRIHVVRLSRILVGGWLPEYWLVLMGSVVKSSMTPGWVKSRFLNGICGDRDDRKLKLEMWVIVVWIKGESHSFFEDHYRLVALLCGVVDAIHHHIEIRNLRRSPVEMMNYRHQQVLMSWPFRWAWGRVTPASAMILWPRKWDSHVIAIDRGIHIITIRSAMNYGHRLVKLPESKCKPSLNDEQSQSRLCDSRSLHMA